MRRISLWFLAVFVALTSAAAQAQTAEWLVSQHGKQVGTARASVTPAGSGYASTSVISISMEGLKYALSKTETLNSARALEHAELSAAVNGQAVRIVAQQQTAKLQLATSANGRRSTTPLPVHDAAVLMPDFDPGAWETLLALAAARNNHDLWAVIPKQAGSVLPATVATYADEKGTLDGHPIAVHHLVATIAGAETHLFVGPRNELLQAELPQPGFALVRKGFVLTPPSKAGAASAQP